MRQADSALADAARMRRGPDAQWMTAVTAALATAAIAAEAEELRLAVLLAMGVLLGITLYHAGFGFTGAWRRLIVKQEVTEVRIQLAMVGLATVLFAPVLALGEIFGRQVAGAVAPAGLQVAAGAFLFGIGMQLGGGCGSGTLYSVGGGSSRMTITLAAFCAGSFWASLHMGFWQSLPSWDSIALGDALGWPQAVALQLALIGILWWVLGRIGGHAVSPAERHQSFQWRRVWAGPWPLAGGAVLLALLNFATLLIAGHPWTITWAFTLWGAKAARLLGWNPEGDPFWSGDFQRAALNGSILEDITSLMDIGIVLGALAAAALAGRFKSSAGLSSGRFIAAVIGGLLLGYGSRIAFGCNIGAFFSGVASTSLHGWLWIAAALPGTWVGVKLRPYFSLKN